MTAAMLSLTVEYGTPIKPVTAEDRIAAGHFAYVTPTAHDQRVHDTKRGTETIEVTLFHLDRSLQTHEVLREIESFGLRAASFEELLAFVPQYPPEYTEFPVAAAHMAGSFFIWEDAAGRSLGLQTRYDKRWRPNTRFLCVHV